MRIKNRTINFRILIYLLITLLCLVCIFLYYYVYMKKTTQDEVYNSLRRDASYLCTRVDEAINQAIDAAKAPGYTTALQKSIFSDDPVEKLSNMTTARELIATARDQNEFVVDLFYYASTGHLYTISMYYDNLRNNMKEYGFDKQIKINSFFISDKPIHDKTASFYFIYIPIHRTAMGISQRTRQIGLCAILFDFAPIAKNCEDIIGENESAYFLYNDEIVSSLHPISDVTFSDLAGLSHDGDVKLSSRDYCYHVANCMDGKIVTLTPKTMLGIKNVTFNGTFYVLIVATVLLFAFLLFLLNKEYSKKTENIVDELKSIRSGEGNMRVSVPKFSELSKVATEINSMLERLEESAERENKAREKLLYATVAQQEAEMSAYRSQINPHFFFNTLECVRSMAQYYNADMIEEIVTAMSKTFRYSLYSDMIVELSSELDMLKQYFVITNFRFPDKYILKEEIDDETLTYRVPSMILQPLVENCIKHAFVNMPIGKKNEIKVKSMFTQEGLLRIVVSDNGRGMSEEALDELKNETFKEEDIIAQKDSIGIRNIYERIKLFDKRNEMLFSSKVGEYTKVELILYPAFIHK